MLKTNVNLIPGLNEHLVVSDLSVQLVVSSIVLKSGLAGFTSDKSRSSGSG